uniref:Right handed beta helix domain-containing protein n=1 Tax=Amphimedon queenslandica TaxID=400682 RepID=A0A1X7V9U5_AMPQE
MRGLLCLLLFSISVSAESNTTSTWISTWIIVSDEGVDSHECHTGEVPCLTLDHALDGLRSNMIIRIDTKEVNLTRAHYFESMEDITITSLNNTTDDEYPTMDHSSNVLEEGVTITCPEVGAGLSFVHSVNIEISNLSFINCAISHKTSALGNWSCNKTKEDCTPLIFPNASSAVFLYNCTRFTLNHTYFSSGHGSGVSLYNVLGNVIIENSHFVNHTLLHPAIPCTNINDYDNCSVQSTGLYIEFTYCEEMTSTSCGDKFHVRHVNYLIRDSLFKGNRNLGSYRNYTDIRPYAGLQREQHWPFGKGGGLGIAFRSYNFKYLNLTVERTAFIDNEAVYGGGMYLQFEPGYSDHGFFKILGCDFIENHGLINGGGLDLDFNVLYHTIHHDMLQNQSFRNHLSVGYNQFNSNIAYWGGGVSLVLYPTNVSYLITDFISSKWNSNRHIGGAGAVGIFKKERPEENLLIVPKVTFTDCIIHATEANRNFSMIPCSLYSESIPLLFYGFNLFTSNRASALCLSDTGAMFFNFIHFSHNTGLNGGALFLTGKSYITVSNNVHMEFNNNSARLGGAIYYLAPIPLEMNTSGSCFVKYHQEGNFDTPPEYWSVDVTFSGNAATQGGDAVFISNPKNCQWPNEPSLFDPNRNKTFDYSRQSQNSSTHVTSTPPQSMYITGNVVEQEQCFTSMIDTRSPWASVDTNSTDNTNAVFHHYMMPGHMLGVKVHALDYFNQSVSTVLSIECHNAVDYIFSPDICNETSFNIDGRMAQSSTSINNIITGPRNEDFVLLFRTYDPISIVIPVHVHLTSCCFGYKYIDNNKCLCGYDLTSSTGSVGPVACIINATKSPDVDRTSSTIPCVKRHYWAGSLPVENKIFYQFCHTGKCSFLDKLKCGKYSDYQVLLNRSCINDLSGPLCSSCDHSKSVELTYNAYSCSPCSISHQIGLFCLIFLGCFLIVILILILLRLNVRVSTAAFYSFLYFYSVLPVFLWAKEQGTALEVIIAVITSITSLDFTLLQYTHFCLFNGVMAIHYEFLHYVYPVTIALLIAVIIKCDKYCFKKLQLFTGDSAVQVLCIMLLIVYTSISETSLNILLPLYYFDGSANESDVIYSEAYIYVDPGVTYFHITNHLPFWIVAFLIEFGIVLPFGIFMTIAPFLMRCMNFTRVKPLLDEYQNCFHDNHRWYAGVYLLARQALFLISMVCSHPEIMSYVQQIFCLLLLILVSVLQPYRNPLINKMDIFFLMILTIISFSGYNPTSSQTFANEEAHEIILGFLSLIPFTVIVIGFIGLAVRNYLVRPLVLKKVLGLHHVISDQSDTLSNTSEEPPLRSDDLKSYSERELPPRFYDEEEVFNETTRLLQSTPRGGGGGRGNMSINTGLPHTH